MTVKTRADDGVLGWWVWMLDAAKVGMSQDFHRYERLWSWIYERITKRDRELRTENARLRAELAAAPRWVSVTERLPGKAQPWEYIVARLNNGAHVSAIYDGEQWLEFDNEIEDWIPLVNVTHWYRVPELVPHAPEVKH